MLDRRYNLIDEPWIPIADLGPVSLWDAFTRNDLKALGGNPVQKIALLKLLQAIAQAAATPADSTAWKALAADGLAKACLAYLDRWHDRFDLYGPTPFLQMPAIAPAGLQSYGAVLPDIATGNTTVLTQSQSERPLQDPERALLLVCLMGFSLGGKKTDNRIVLTPGYTGKQNAKGKPSTGQPGPSLARFGLLHNFILGETLLDTVRLNLLTESDIARSNAFPGGLGKAPWEQMPAGEDCPIAQALRATLMGRLVPLARFCLLAEDGLHYSEGIRHPGHKDGGADPSCAINYGEKEPKALWCNPDKRPWRELTAILSLLSGTGARGFESRQISCCLDRASQSVPVFAIWSGGLRVSFNAGEQYVSGNDDFVESVVWLHSSALGESWYAALESEMTALDGLAKHLFGCVLGYFNHLGADDATTTAMTRQATSLFWQLCEHEFQTLITACEPAAAGAVARDDLRRRFASHLRQAFNHHCPNNTARQLDAWSRSTPNLSSYLHRKAVAS